jgi:hypothetical protein
VFLKFRAKIDVSKRFTRILSVYFYLLKNETMLFASSMLILQIILVHFEKTITFNATTLLKNL